MPSDGPLRRRRGSIKRHRWTWVACSMLAVYLLSMVAGTILSVVNGTFQPDAAGQVGLALGFSAFMIVGDERPFLELAVVVMSVTLWGRNQPTLAH